MTPPGFVATARALAANWSEGATLTHMEPRIAAAPPRIVSHTAELLRELRAARDEVADHIRNDDRQLAVITPLRPIRLSV